MTDTTSTTNPPKKMWTRCTGCKQRIFNEPLDIKIHAPLCPQNMLLAIQRLNITIYGDKRIEGTVDDAIVTRLSSLEGVIDDFDEHGTEPSVDPDGVDEAAYTDVIGEADEDETVAHATPTDDDGLPAAPPQINTAGLYPTASTTSETDQYTHSPFRG